MKKALTTIVFLMSFCFVNAKPLVSDEEYCLHFTKLQIHNAFIIFRNADFERDYKLYFHSFYYRKPLLKKILYKPTNKYLKEEYVFKNIPLIIKSHNQDRLNKVARYCYNTKKRKVGVEELFVCNVHLRSDDFSGFYFSYADSYYNNEQKYNSCLVYINRKNNIKFNQMVKELQSQHQNSGDLNMAVSVVKHPTNFWNIFYDYQQDKANKYYKNHNY